MNTTPTRRRSESIRLRNPRLPLEGCPLRVASALRCSRGLGFPPPLSRSPALPLSRSLALPLSRSLSFSLSAAHGEASKPSAERLCWNSVCMCVCAHARESERERERESEREREREILGTRACVRAPRCARLRPVAACCGLLRL